MINETKKPEINLDNTQAVNCEGCGNNTFTESLMLRRASPIVTGQTKDMILPIGPVFVCTKCGDLCDGLLSEELRSYIEKKKV